MINIGFRIFTKVVRPDKALIEGFRGLPVANIADNMGRFTCVDTAIKSLNHRPILGTAYTVKVPPGDNLMFHKAMDLALPGDIIVVDGEGCEKHSLCGSLMMHYAQACGIAGFVVDGCVRDYDDMINMDFPVYARGVQPKGPYKNGPGEIGIPVSIGGIVIRPGDILVGDSDGLVCIRQEDAVELLERVRAHHQKEVAALEKIAKGTYTKKWIDEVLIAGKCQVIDT